MGTNSKIVLWSKSGCHLCDELKAYFAENHLVYINIDVEGKDFLRDVLELKYGIRHVPVVEIGSAGTFHGLTEIDFPAIELLLAKSHAPVS